VANASAQSVNQRRKMKTNQNKRLLITSSLICTLFIVSLIGALNVYSSFASSTKKIDDQQKIINDLEINNSQQIELIVKERPYHKYQSAEERFLSDC
jgi:hypothetical protein